MAACFEQCKVRLHGNMAIAFLGKRLSGQMFFWANVLGANVYLGKCLCRRIYWGQTSFWAKVFLGKCLSGQMYF
jgi:hypothetical protein